MSNTAPSRADPAVVFPLGAHHKKPHSPTHPNKHDKQESFNALRLEKFHIADVWPFQIQCLD